jgi:hypothetical protein
MKTIEIPELKDCMTDHIENKILQTPAEGFVFWQILKEAAKWKSKYEIIYVDIDAEDYFWIKQLKGIKFSSREEAEMYAFLDYCKKEGSYIYYTMKKIFDKED